jgi:hypothetical protein
MLRRLTLGFFVLACAAVVAACSSGDVNPPSSGGVSGIGPNFVTNTIYVANTTQNDVEIYTPSPNPSATPQHSIGGSNTGLNGPQYLAFDKTTTRLYVTNYNAGTTAGSVTIYQKFATGNVLPFGSYTFSAGVSPHGVAVTPDGVDFVTAITQPNGVFTDALQVINISTDSLLNNIAGPNTGLHTPMGVAIDANKNIYVANSAVNSAGTPSVEIFALPSASPAPTSSPTTSPSPTPTASVSPTPTPTPFSDDVFPTTTITSTSFVTPTGIGLDSKGNIYVADAGNPRAGKAPAILVFNAPFAANVNNAPQPLVPFATITSTALVMPVDVKVDSGGTIYVIDQGSGLDQSKLLIFPPNSNGSVSPTAISLPHGTASGLALSP